MIATVSKPRRLAAMLLAVLTLAAAVLPASGARAADMQLLDADGQAFGTVLGLVNRAAHGMKGVLVGFERDGRKVALLATENGFLGRDLYYTGADCTGEPFVRRFGGSFVGIPMATVIGDELWAAADPAEAQPRLALARRDGGGTCVPVGEAPADVLDPDTGRGEPIRNTQRAVRLADGFASDHRLPFRLSFGEL